MQRKWANPITNFYVKCCTEQGRKKPTLLFKKLRVLVYWRMEKKDCSHCDHWLANQKSFRNYLLQKYIQELLVILVCIGGIIYAGCHKLIQPETTGALLGVAVGYGLKGLRKLHK